METGDFGSSFDLFHIGELDLFIIGFVARLTFSCSLTTAKRHVQGKNASKNWFLFGITKQTFIHRRIECIIQTQFSHSDSTAINIF